MSTTKIEASIEQLRERNHPGLINDIIESRLMRDIEATPDESELGETTRLELEPFDEQFGR